MSKKKKHTTRNVTIFTLVAIAVVVASYFLYIGLVEGRELDIQTYYDANMNEINTYWFQQAVIGDVEGVHYIDFLVGVTNSDEYAASFEIIDASPQEFKDTLPLNQPLTATSGQRIEWTSDLFHVIPFENQTVNFSVTVRGTSDYKASVDKTATIVVPIMSDEPLDFDLDLNNGDTYGPGDDSDFNTNADGLEFEDFGSTDIWFEVDIDYDGVLDHCVIGEPYFGPLSSSQATNINNVPVIYEITETSVTFRYSGTGSTVWVAETNPVVEGGYLHYAEC